MKPARIQTLFPWILSEKLNSAETPGSWWWNAKLVPTNFGQSDWYCFTWGKKCGYLGSRGATPPPFKSPLCMQLWIYLFKRCVRCVFVCRVDSSFAVCSFIVVERDADAESCFYFWRKPRRELLTLWEQNKQQAHTAACLSHSGVSFGIGPRRTVETFAVRASSAAERYCRKYTLHANFSAAARNFY